jgi:hypothetical protein
MPELTTAGRWLILVGLGLAALGGLVWVFGRTGVPFGRLPGDFRFETGSVSCFFPLASMIVLSLLLTLVLNLVLRLLNK